ncbi:unnamed protein product [Urochloa humidicola]
MVSIVPLQRRTEASSAAAAARSIFSPFRDEEGSAAAAAAAMDLSGTQGELPIPMHATVVSPYGGAPAAAAGHVLQLHRHHEQHGSSNGQSPAAAAELPASPPVAVAAEETDHASAGKKRAAGGAVRYRECLKNHAAAIGGSATDGCGEFMPSGEDGSLEALKCSACGCHRNFHRKDLHDAADISADHDDVIYSSGHRAAHRLLAPAMPPYHRGGTAGADPYAAYAAAAARALPPPPGHGHHHHQYVMPLSMVHNSESDEMDGGRGGGGGGGGSSSRKRFRTKFTAEQKARMLEFAERVGWRLQKLEEAMVQAFCEEIGVKRRVLKVWMHNNKHSLATTRRLDAPPMAAEGSTPGAAVAAAQMPRQMMMPPGVMPAAVQPTHGGPGSPPTPAGLKLE